MGLPPKPTIASLTPLSMKPGNPPPVPGTAPVAPRFPGIAPTSIDTIPTIKQMQDVDVAKILKEAPDGLVQMRILATMMTNTAIDLAVEGRLVGNAMDAALAATKMHSVVFQYTHQKMPTSPDEYGSSEQIADNLKAMEHRLLDDRDALLDEIEEAEVL